jgi:amino acid transporter
MTPSLHGLSQRSVGGAELMTLGVCASCPMAVLAGSVVATYAATGVVDMAPSFILLGAALALFAVGFLAMTRDIPHPASFYALLSHGLGPVVGLAGAAVSLLAYYVVQLSLYGLLGAITAGLFGGAWWVWSLAAWLAVGLLGVLHIGLNTRLLAVILVLQLLVIALVDVVGLTSPAAGQVDFEPLQLGNLLTSSGLGGVLAFGIASFIGFESVAVYREEAVSHRSVALACYGTIGFLSVFYAASSWALALAVGPNQIIDTTRDPAANLPFGVLGDHYGPFVQAIGQALLLTGLFAALLSFQNVVARYIYSLARETVLPSGLSTLGGAKGGVPVAGSIAQSSTAAVGIAVFAATGVDPLTTLFTWGAELCSLGILVLMICTSVAVVRYYRAQGRPLGFTLGVAPVVSAVALTAVLVVSIVNLDSITGPEAAPTLRWALPSIVLLVAGAGALLALHIRRTNPMVYLAIGRGVPRPLAVPERALADLEM